MVGAYFVAEAAPITMESIQGFVDAWKSGRVPYHVTMPMTCVRVMHWSLGTSAEGRMHPEKVDLSPVASSSGVLPKKEAGTGQGIWKVGGGLRQLSICLPDFRQFPATQQNLFRRYRSWHPLQQLLQLGEEAENKQTNARAHDATDWQVQASALLRCLGLDLDLT